MWKLPNKLWVIDECNSTNFWSKQAHICNRYYHVGVRILTQPLRCDWFGHVASISSIKLWAFSDWLLPLPHPFLRQLAWTQTHNVTCRHSTTMPNSLPAYWGKNCGRSIELNIFWNRFVSEGEFLCSFTPVTFQKIWTIKTFWALKKTNQMKDES